MPRLPQGLAGQASGSPEGPEARPARNAWLRERAGTSKSTRLVLFTDSERTGAVLRLSKLTDYAVVVMARLALDGAGPAGQVQTAPGLAAATGITEPTVAKV